VSPKIESLEGMKGAEAGGEGHQAQGQQKGRHPGTFFWGESLTAEESIQATGCQGEDQEGQQGKASLKNQGMPQKQLQGHALPGTGSSSSVEHGKGKKDEKQVDLGGAGCGADPDRPPARGLCPKGKGQEGGTCQEGKQGEGCQAGKEGASLAGGAENPRQEEQRREMIVPSEEQG
jgi:hypothetical protein